MSTVAGELAWPDQLAEAGTFTAPVVEQILSLHGKRGQRAIEAVGERRVKQYRDFTVVVGHESEYVVEDRSCTCADTHYNLDPDDPNDLCWHVLATIMAEQLEVKDTHDMWYSDVHDFL